MIIQSNQCISGDIGAKRDFTTLKEFYIQFLVDDLLPWWLKHSIDKEYGGIFSCISDDGKVLSEDKYIWSQVRALWTFSTSYNRVRNDSGYLELSKQIFEFIKKCGQNENGNWNYLVDRKGNLKEGALSFQTDAFAICGLVEYAIASGCEEAIAMAKKTYERAKYCIAHPGSYQTKPYPIPEGTKAQRISMQFSLAFAELGKFLKDERVLQDGIELTRDVLENFCREGEKFIAEYLSLDNEILDGAIGRYISPGHGIETAWFQLENLRNSNHCEWLKQSAEVMRWCFDKGWDNKHGGLYLGVDLQGLEPYLPNSETKIWWPFTEALCGALMAYEVLEEDWCLDWYLKTHNWAFTHFPDRENGEWSQRLDRFGNKMDKVVALPVKDPFHLPRGVIYSIDCLKRLELK